MMAYNKELSAYNVLQSLQGKLVPELYGFGPYSMGVYFIAVSFVEGTPLHRLDVIPLEVGRAAAATLDMVHRCGKMGFLHGDVGAPNFICLKGANRCVLVDFGRSRLGASRAEQQAEMQQLLAVVGLS